MDGSLVRCALDLSGRAGFFIGNSGVSLPEPEDLVEFFRALVRTSRCTLHLDVLRVDNRHHVWGAAFKALGLCLKSAVARGESHEVPSLKGVL